MTDTPVTVGVGLLPSRPLRELGEAAAEAEALGFGCVWIPDERFFRDVMVTLAHVARRTRRVRLGPCVTDPFVRHPALTAASLGTLQELSGGRLVVGLGAGISGFEALGIVSRRPAAVIAAAVRLIRALHAGDTVTAEAPCRFRGRMDFGPVPAVPIYVAGRGPRILELAGEVADGVILGGLASPAVLRPALAHVDAGLVRAGRARRDLVVAAWTHTVIGTNAQRAWRRARLVVVGILLSSRDILPSLGISLSTPLSTVLASVRYGDHWGLPDDVLALLPAEVVDAFTISGTPADCLVKLQRMITAGVEHFALRLWPVDDDSPATPLRLFAEAVLPQLPVRRTDVPVS